MERSVPIGSVKLADASERAIPKLGPPGDLGPVQVEPNRKRGLQVLAGAHRTRKAREIGSDRFGRQLDQRFDELAPAGTERIVRKLDELGAELKQPRHAVRHLEAPSAGCSEVRDLARDALGRKASIERGHDFSFANVLAEQPQNSQECPVAVDSRMPIKTTEERRSELA